MKLNKKELRRLIKETLIESGVLEEGKRGRLNPFHFMSPYAGEMYAAAAGKDSFLATREKEEQEARSTGMGYKPGYGDGSNLPSENELRYQMSQMEEEEFARNQENFPFEIARQLSSQYGIPANVNNSGGINIKHKGETHRISVNGRLPYDEAFSDAYQQIVDLDTDKAIRQSASRRRMRRGEESIEIDDPLMERSFRGSLIDLIEESTIEDEKKEVKKTKVVKKQVNESLSRGSLYRKRYYGRY